MIRIEVIGRWGEMGGVRRGDSVRIGHPKTIPHSHERIVAIPRRNRLPPEPKAQGSVGRYAAMCIIDTDYSASARSAPYSWVVLSSSTIYDVPFSSLRIGAKDVVFRKAVVKPNFPAPTVLVSDPWDYVEMWLKREGSKVALFYWQQARHFFAASISLPMASPLASYYCFLNAAKTLLTVKEIPLKDAHGVRGQRSGTRVALVNETVRFRPSGILSALCAYFGEPAHDEIYSVKDIFYYIVAVALLLPTPAISEVVIATETGRGEYA